MTNKVTNPDMLKKLRSDADLTQKELALQTGVTLGVIKTLETGRVQLNEENALTFSNFFGVDVETFYMEPPRNTIFITVAIQKGGTGKTTVAVNLAFALAEKGKKVLLVDTDSQRNASGAFGFRKIPHPEKNFFDAYVNGQNLLDHVCLTDYENLDIVPGSHKLSIVEPATASIRMREQHMDLFFNRVREAEVYDFVIVDTNPSIGNFNAAILYASDEVLIPMEPEQHSMDVLELFLGELKSIQLLSKRMNIMGILLNKCEYLTNAGKKAMTVMELAYPEYLMDVKISQNVKIRDSQWEYKPVGDHIPHGKSANEYRDLAKEVISIVKQR